METQGQAETISIEETIFLSNLDVNIAQLILKYDQFVYGFNKRNEFKEELKNFFIEF